MQDQLRYVVVVPYYRDGGIRQAQYPGGGQTYSRCEAVNALEKLHRGFIQANGSIPDELVPWAESTTDDNGERFELEDVNNGRNQ